MVIMIIALTIGLSVGACNPANFFFRVKKSSSGDPRVQISPPFFYRAFKQTLSQSIELIEGFPNLYWLLSELISLARYGRFTVGVYVRVVELTMARATTCWYRPCWCWTHGGSGRYHDEDILPMLPLTGGVVVEKCPFW